MEITHSQGQSPNHQRFRSAAVDGARSAEDSGGSVQQLTTSADTMGSRNDGPLLRQRNSLLEQENAALSRQLDEYHRSLAWLLVRKAQKVRGRLFPEGRFSGRCWSLFSRFVRASIAQGPSVAIMKARDKIKRKFRYAGRLRKAENHRATFKPIFGAKPWAGFEDLPWRFLGKRAENHARRPGHFKVLLVSHSACRTGAPHCLLRLAQELTKVPDIDCWIVLRNGGELADSFAQIAPTLEVDELVNQGFPRDDIPGLIASRFRAMASQGMAVCNTMAVSEYHEALAAHNVPVLSWVHELPTFMDFFGGVKAMERIKAASRQVVVPADVVREALVSRFGFDRDDVRTINNGLDARTSHLDRHITRLRVREELGLPDDARIVLGCGTVDMRKGADLFVQLARKILTDPDAATVAVKTWFVWVGHCGDENFRRWLFHDATAGKIDNRVLFIGSRTDTAPYFMAADLFALTSREDPCPFANLEAMESGLVVVSFLDSGGAPEVLVDAGVCVPYLDVDAMAKATRELLADCSIRTEKGRRGQALIGGSFTWPRFMQEFLPIVHSKYHYHPGQDLKVSVIVPNYQHARYLEDRLRSIFEQTLPPHEIVFLDDASPDGSLEVANRLAHLSPVPMRIVVNEKNSGSTFRQWIKGLELATGDLIWIAESDDCCHPRLLERLVPEFYDPEVVFAYCQSALIGPEGERLAEDFLGHTDDISKSRWRSSYRVTGTEEVELALSQKNTIPNASAAVFRRPKQLDFADELATLRFAGDWFFYAMLLRSGKISYLSDILNFYRRHDQTVSHNSIRGNTHAQESLYVKARVFETFPVSANAIAHSLGQTVLEYDWLTERFGLQRPALSANPRVVPLLERIREALRRRVGERCGLKILLVIDDMEPGKQCLATIDLANALASEHLVFLCNAQPFNCDSSMTARVNERVLLLEGSLGQTPWTSASDSSSSEESRENRRVEILRELIRIHQIDVIHTRFREADRLVLRIKDELDIPWFRHFDGEDNSLVHGNIGPGSSVLTIQRARPSSARESA